MLSNENADWKQLYLVREQFFKIYKNGFTQRFITKELRKIEVDISCLFVPFLPKKKPYNYVRDFYSKSCVNGTPTRLAVKRNERKKNPSNVIPFPF